MLALTGALSLILGINLPFHSPFQKPMTANIQISLIILHIVWGGITGFLYNPSQEAKE